MWKVLIYVFFTLYILHLFMALCQAFGLFKFTDKEITLPRMLTPFYYWFHLIKEKEETTQPKENSEKEDS